jgi:hypothetical protein
MAASFLTTTRFCAIRIAPCARVTVMIIGNSSGVSPTASATANRKDSSTGLANARFISSTNSVRKMVSRRIMRPRRWMPRSNAVGGSRAASAAAIAPKRVALPVATTSMIASPPTIEVPANSALKASGGVVAWQGPGYLSTG